MNSAPALLGTDAESMTMAKRQDICHLVEPSQVYLPRVLVFHTNSLHLYAVQISRAEARAAAAERQVQIREVRARDAQRQQGLKRKGKKKGPPSSEAPPPKKRSRAEGPSTEAVQALVASGHNLSTRDSSPVADFRSLRAGNVRAKVGFVPRWSIKEDDTLSVSHVARELVLKGSLPRDAAEAQRQGTAAMITSACIFMAGAQNQVGQLALRAEAMARDLEASEREKSVLENERSVLLEKMEHLEEDLLRTSQEWDQKLAELKAQITTRVREAEIRGAEMYRASEGFWEEVKRAITPGFIMGATEVRDWVLEHYPEVSFEDSGLIFEEEC
ncbi:uncharacterized protein LOC122092238 [Macadamia integrifolia]|uniref:uncharacterized protein LOC122092238 n=1 Tax=Macadamia integrifolia TaxID=60698 RepID=UPI001C4F1C9D|nr:uncharacterized protein LOC122092238 [Macadamia integrifolia]